MPVSADRDVVYCFECGSEISPKAEICPDCGVEQPLGEVEGTEDGVSTDEPTSDGPIECGNCEEQIEPGTRSCPHCGYNPKRNMRKRGALIALIGLGASISGVGLIVGVPLLLWATKRLHRAPGTTAAYTNSKGKPFKTLGF